MFNIPKSEEESDKLIEHAKQTIPLLEDEDLWNACKELIGLAGSFNHNLTHKHRSEILDILSNVGEDAIDPVLQDLTDHPRAEQFDITIAFIKRLISVRV